VIASQLLPTELVEDGIIGTERVWTKLKVKLVRAD